MLSIGVEIERLHALRGIQAALLRLKWLRASTRFQIAAHRHGLALKYGYNPAQPRAPKGDDGAGEWVDTGAGNRARLASADLPNLGPKSKLGIAVELALMAMKVFRKEKLLYDLLGRKEGTVSYTRINDREIFGVNSDSPEYKDSDWADADNLRSELLAKYPQKMATENIGQRPNDAVFHAEANGLMRAARENGGSLAGQNLRVHVDKPMCSSCDKILPLIGLELGDPTVTFVGPTGSIKTMHDGVWIR